MYFYQNLHRMRNCLGACFRMAGGRGKPGMRGGRCKSRRPLEEDIKFVQMVEKNYAKAAMPAFAEPTVRRFHNFCGGVFYEIFCLLVFLSFSACPKDVFLTPSALRSRHVCCMVKSAVQSVFLIATFVTILPISSCRVGFGYVLSIS